MSFSRFICYIQLKVWFFQGSSEENSVEMTKMYEAISEQKNVIMKCLDSDQCDINALNEQLEILQAMQEKY